MRKVYRMKRKVTARVPYCGFTPATGIAWNMDCAHAAEDGKARTVAKLFAHQKTSSLIVQVTVLAFSMCTLLRETGPKRPSRCQSVSAPKATQVPHAIYEPVVRNAKIAHIQIATTVYATANKALGETFVLKHCAWKIVVDMECAKAMVHVSATADGKAKVVKLKRALTVAHRNGKVW